MAGDTVLIRLEHQAGDARGNYYPAGWVGPWDRKDAARLIAARAAKLVGPEARAPERVDKGPHGLGDDDAIDEDVQAHPDDVAQAPVRRKRTPRRGASHLRGADGGDGGAERAATA